MTSVPQFRRLPYTQGTSGVMIAFFAGIGIGIGIIAMINPIPESPPALELYHPYSCYDSKFFGNLNWNHQILKNKENPIPESVPVRNHNTTNVLMCH